MHLRTFLISLPLITLLCSCASEKKENKNTVEFPYFEITIPETCKVEPGKEMELSRISCKDSEIIKVFNFGNKPVTVEGNINRWQGQLDTVFQTTTKTYQNDIIYSVKIEGLKESVKTDVLGAIVPTKEGPYYFKAVDLESNTETEVVFTKMMKSIKYN